MSVDTELEELFELLRFESVSADPACRDGVNAAGEWVAEFARGAGGSGELTHDWGGPLMVADLPASESPQDAPTVIAYGHFDVQPPGPVDAWTTPPFEPSVRGGWIYARGATDNKGNMFVLLRALAELRAAAALPVNVHLICEGEEEIGGPAIVDCLRADDSSAAAFVSFDCNMPLWNRPVIYTSTRGLIYLRVGIRTGQSELHSGIFGGAALNALNLITEAVAPVLALPPELHQGCLPLEDWEREVWHQVDPDDRTLTDAGAASAVPAGSFYERTVAQPSVDLHGIVGGSDLQKTIVVPEATAMLSIRPAPGQDAELIADRAVALMEAAVPPQAELTIKRLETTSGYLQRPDSRPVALASAAIESEFGAPVSLLRGGSSIPAQSAAAQRGIPVVLTGFGSPESRVHGVDERFSVNMLERGIRIGMGIFSNLGELA